MTIEAQAASSSRWVHPAAALLLGASLTGCAGNPTYQDSIANAAQGEPFSLPRGEESGAPIPLWDSVLILCPYGDTTEVPEPFTAEAHDIRTSSTDAVQWLLFAEGESVKTISLDRSAVDFCKGSAPPAEHPHTQTWRAEKSDGAWLMTAELRGAGAG